MSSKVILNYSLAAAFLFLSFTAKAEEVEVVDAPKSTVYRDSSEHNRMDKQFFLAAQLFGFGPGSTAQGGVIGGYYLNRNSILQLEIVNGGRDWNFVSSHKIHAKSYGLHLKQLQGNSFYYKIGADYTDIEASYNTSWTYSPNESYNLRGNKFGAGISIGNQWQWKNFTLGCDWVGISVPLTHTTTEESYTGTASWAGQYLEDDKKIYLERTTVQLLHFYLGASF